MDTVEKKSDLPQESGQDAICMGVGFQWDLHHGRDNDELDIGCVWGGGGILDVIVVFRGREQRLIIRAEESGCFSDLTRVSNT